MLSNGLDLKWESRPNIIVEVKIIGMSDDVDIESLPRQVAVLFRKVKVGVSRDELMQSAFKLGLNPIWESKPRDRGVMHIVIDDVEWGIGCTYRLERIH
mgnify:CR=1 FL=1